VRPKSRIGDGSVSPALPARNTDVRAAEVELLSDEPEVKGADEEKIDDDHGHDH
jgi:hypothetical protein